MNDVTPRETGSKPNVYFIDDSATMREVVKIAFRRENFNVVTCSDMASAVAQFGETVPDAVISDVIMPDMNGIEAAISIRGFLPTCKILLFSGQAATADLLENARTRGYEFEILAKPVHPQDLLTKLRG